MRFISVQAEDFDPGALLARLGEAGTGGISSFIGSVRPHADGSLKALRLEHYPGMTEAALDKLAAEAEARWHLTGCVIIHRIGRLEPGQKIVFVGTASPHRAESLAATAFLIDQLKTRAPFWKAEERADGSTIWVQARVQDDEAAAAWEKTPAKNLPHGSGRL